MSNSPAQKIAVVTGASSGIGAVYADRLAARGYGLILVARRADRLQALSARLSATHDVPVELINADLTREEDLARVEQVLATNPAVRMLVNNAGSARLAPLAEATVAESLAQIALNVTALTRLTHAVLPAFRARDEGVIVNIASVLAIHAMPISAVYSGTKGFVLNFSRGLQQELSGTGVRLHLVLPASTATEIWDNAGVPLAGLDQAKVMTTENLVDAALAGFDQGEAVTWPSVPDIGLWEQYDAVRTALFAATQTGRPAARYKVA